MRVASRWRCWAVLVFFAAACSGGGGDGKGAGGSAGATAGSGGSGTGGLSSGGSSGMATGGSGAAGGSGGVGGATGGSGGATGGAAGAGGVAGASGAGATSGGAGSGAGAGGGGGGDAGASGGAAGMGGTAGSGGADASVTGGAAGVSGGSGAAGTSGTAGVGGADAGIDAAGGAPDGGAGDAGTGDADADAALPQCAQSGASIDVSGTITYGGSLTGRVFAFVRDPNDGRVFGGTTAGLVSAQPLDYTIRGLPVSNGTFEVVAYVDVLGVSTLNTAADANGLRTFALSGSSVTGVDVALASGVDVAPPAPAFEFFTTGPDFVAIRVEPLQDVFGGEIVDHYVVYWTAGADAGPPGPGSFDGSMTLPAGSVSMVIEGLSTGSTYSFAVTGVDGTAEGPPSSPTTVTLAAPSGGHTVSGSVALDGLGLGPAATVWVSINSETSTHVVGLDAPSNPEPFSVGGVPDGTYTAFVFVDADGDGVISQDEPHLFDEQAAFTVSGADVALGTLAVPSEDVLARATVGLHPLGYTAEVRVEPNRRIPVAVVLCSGPGVTTTSDLAPEGDGFVSYRHQVDYGSTPPSVGDSFTLIVTYDDESTEAVTVPITGVFAEAPTLVSPTTSTTSTVPTFTWTLPSSLPATYAVVVEVLAGAPPGSPIWHSPPLPSGTTSVAYDSDGTASVPTLSPGAHVWRVAVVDDFGNRAESEATFDVVP